MTAFVDYLKSLRNSLGTLGPSSELCLTFGNESCDLDSIVSSLVYAHFKARKFTDEPSGAISLPLLQCRREDLILNQEAMFLFEMLGIDGSELLFLDDITSEVLSTVEKLSLVLVDHNAPTGNRMFVPYLSSVTKVIDHHQESVNSIANEPGVSTNIEMTGSCASLVASEVLEDSEYTVEPPAAVLLLSAILLDTGDLKAAKRVTPTDEFAVEELSKFLPTSFNREDHFSKLFKARFDISMLSVAQALRKDYKECEISRYLIGFCSVPALLSDFLSRPNGNADVMEFFSSHNLNALIVLGVLISDPSATKIQRQIAVFQPEGINSEFSESVINILEDNGELKCERIYQLPEFQGVLLEQKNTDMSRKDVIPIVTSFVKSIESEYPRTDLSPSNIMLQESEQTTTAAVIGATSEQQFPLEPDITIISNEEATEEVSPPEPAKPAQIKTAAKPRAIPEYTSAEEFKERRSHRYVSVGGEETIVSLDMVGPYKKIIQHAGYIGKTRQALVVISACYLPPKSLPNYNHVVHHTFYYVLSVLDQLIVDDYTIVYLHSGVPRHSMPSLRVLHKFYRTIDRRLRKQLSQLYIVHPTFLVKAMLRLARPFISTKFWRKVHFIPTLQDLSEHVKLDEEFISAPVAAVDKVIMSHRPTVQKYQTESLETNQKDESVSGEKQVADESDN